jgi:tRNA-Thr(GGU) m(6)t(6)A37 methyltransferase TsaA
MARPIPPKHYASEAAFPERIQLRPIGVVRSPHKERHGTPRQAVLAADPALRPDEGAVLELFPEVLGEAAVRDLAGVEMIWVLAWMHLDQGWSDEVVPPGEDPRRPKSLLATRAPHRPNPIALSAVRLVRVDGLRLHVERCDLLDGTPILDVKPYVPYADAFPNARAGWLDGRDVPQQ